MLEFSDEVYDTLVEPMKKNKSFSKLLATLVNGYLNDSYIRAYADDNLGDMHKAAVDSFSKSIDSMSESLSSMGLFTDELESLSKVAKANFSDIGENTLNEINNSKDENRSYDISSEEITKINTRIDNIQSSFDDRFNQLLNMMQDMQNTANKLISNGMSSTVDNSGVNKEDNNSLETNNSFSEESIIKGTEESDYTNNSEDVNYNIDDKEADDFLSSMLEGNSFEF